MGHILMRENKELKVNTIIKVLWILAVLVGIKSAFTDFGYDNAYTLALSFRHLSGDRLFMEIWDTTQSSIFLTDIFLLPYKLIVPSLTGAALYLQFCGLITYGAAAFFLSKTLSLYADKQSANLAAIFFFTFRVKQTVFMAYADQQILFSVLMLCFIIRFIKDKSRYIFMIMAALMLCLEILSYPTAIILFPFLCIALFIILGKKIKPVLIFAGTCAISGIVYILFLLLRKGPVSLYETIILIFSGDVHGAGEFGDGSFGFYWGGFMYAVAVLTIIIVIAILVAILSKKRDNFFTVLGVEIPVVELLLLSVGDKLSIDWTCAFFILPLLLIFLAVSGTKAVSTEMKQIWIIALIVSASTFVGTILMTNLGMITIVAYFVVAGAVAITLICTKWKQAGVRLVVGVCMAVILHRGIVVWGYGQINGRTYITKMNNYVRNGPTKYIIADRETANRTRNAEAEFKTYLPENSNALLLNNWVYDPVIYMFLPGQICNPNVTDTPHYSKETLTYFTYYPQKTPEYVVVDKGTSYFNSEISEWLNDNFEIYAEGEAYTFFRAK